jgi:hypothetical protein
VEEPRVRASQSHPVTRMTRVASVA